MDNFVPPNSRESEISVIGSILRDARKFEDIDLDQEDFYYAANRVVYQAMKNLMLLGIPIDIVTVGEALEADGKLEDIGGMPYLVDIVENTYAENTKAYARNVKNAAKARKLIQIGIDMQSATGDAWQEVMDHAVKSIMSLEGETKKHEHTLAESLRSAFDMLDAANESDGLVGVDTGLEKLNNVLGGFHDSDLIVIGARPAMGKTALMLNLAHAANTPVGIISAEQPHDQVALRMIASHGRIVATNLRNADLSEAEWGRIAGIASKLNQRNILINDKPAISIAEIVRQARRWKRNNNIDALYVDYLQRIKPTDTKIPKHEQVGEIAITLKELARELQIPVIALAQVNRGVESRPDRRPRMGDLKHSGEIEQEADVIMLLYRDEVYNDDSPDKGIAEILIDKNRHGPSGMIKVAWSGEYMTFSDLAYTYAESYVL